MIRRTLFLLLAVSFLLREAASAETHPDTAFSAIDKIVKTLSSITGWDEKHPVPYGRMTQAQLRKFLAHRIKTTLKPKEIYADELSLKLFGLVPADFDLRKSTVDLLTEQAAAFYDYQEKKLFMLNSASFSSEEMTLAHELSHALADQHFDLSKFIEDANENDDENLAHTAVVEGQASWLMLAYQMRQQGVDSPPTPEMLATIEESAESSAAGYPVLQHSPLYIQQSLMFPYTAGIKFFDAVYKKMGKQAFGAVFTDPPKDSAQVIHPERYFHHDNPSRPELPRVQLTKEGKEIGTGSVGEFDHQMLLWQFLGKEDALDLAPHVRGGTFRIVETGKKKTPVLEYISEWDTPQNAARYFKAYQTIQHKKWKLCDVTKSTSNLSAGQADNGHFVTWLRERTVSTVEGMAELEDWEAATKD